MKKTENEIRETSTDVNAQPFAVGGQAVIEGVMMRTPKAVATAVRRANGSIVVRYDSYTSITERVRWFKFPILRGAVGLLEMMMLGIRTLNWSADVAMKDEILKNNGSTAKTQKAFNDSTWLLALTVLAALGIALIVFMAFPLYVTTAFFSIEQTAFAFNLVAGSIRVILLLLYLLGIARLNDVRRLFQYHGAEHKSVFAFEQGSSLVPHAAMTYSRFHPRCGTSFLLIVVFVSVLAFSVVDGILLLFMEKLTLPLRLAVHLPLVPFVGGLAYEVIKFSAKRTETTMGRFLVAPGLWLQRITTQEPDERQLEVALVALRCALGTEDPAHYAFVPEVELLQSKQ